MANRTDDEGAPMTVHRALLIVIPTLLSALPAYGQTQLCLDAASLDPAAELEASPRENVDAELLALWSSRGIAADSGTYNTIVADLERIALQYPEIAAIPASFNVVPDGLFVRFVDAATRDQAEEGENPDFNCLNELLDQDFAQWYTTLEEWVYLGFDGNYRVEELADLYGRVPGVNFTEFNFNLLLGDAGCSYQDDTGKRTYFFEEWFVLFPSSGPVRLARVDIDGGNLSLVEEPYPYGPALEQEYLDCQAGLLGGPQVVEVPTASSVALGILAAVLAVAGLWISRRSKAP